MVLGMALVLLQGMKADAAQTADGWSLVTPGWRYQFPRDHGPHRDFKSEWWYFTGNLVAADGREFGYEVTWFRQGVMPKRPEGASRFVVQDFKFAHFAISDIPAGQFHFVQKVSRGAYDEAGFGDGGVGPLAWIDDWGLSIAPDGTWHIEAEEEGRSLELRLTPVKGPVIEGEDGISRKSAGPGHASCYYSFTRMRAEGRLGLGGAPVDVKGETWFDHEWATNQLAEDQAGWDWFCEQLGDGTELMLYRMRLKNGQVDPASSGTWTRKDGTVTYLKADDFTLTPQRWWKSVKTAANYPIGWRLEIPRLKVELNISTPMDDQELHFPAITYWEGLTHAMGTAGGVPVTGHGYMELTGYDTALTSMGE
jgi:predicted secreted hydrolase